MAMAMATAMAMAMAMATATAMATAMAMATATATATRRCPASMSAQPASACIAKSYCSQYAECDPDYFAESYDSQADCVTYDTRATSATT